MITATFGPLIKVENRFTHPHEVEFLEFFSSDAIEKVPKDGYWLYETGDARGVTLRIGFSVFDRSVRTELSLAGKVISTVYYEGATLMALRGNELHCDFELEDSKAHLRVELVPHVMVTWSTLKTR